MNQKMVMVLSSFVLAIAKKSAKSACPWLSYQPKVPEQLLLEKKKKSAES